MNFFEIRRYAKTHYTPSTLENILSVVLGSLILAYGGMTIASFQELLPMLFYAFLTSLVFMLTREVRIFSVIPVIVLAWVSHVDDSEKKSVIDSAIQSLKTSRSQGGCL